MRKSTTQLILLLLSPLFFLNFIQAQPEYYGGKEGKKMDWMLFYLNAHYVDSTDNEHLTELAIQRMLQELDPFSRYQSKEQLDKQREEDDGAVNDGLGIRYYVIRDTATITYIDEAGPATEAGLRKGDKILAIDNVSTIGKNFSIIDNKITALRGTEVAFSIYRKPENKYLNLSIISKMILVPSVDASYVLEGNIGYIRVNRFTMKTIGEFRNAIKELKAEGIKNLVLDLRYNRGGVVIGATTLADEFLPSSKIIMHSNGKGFPLKEFFSTEKGNFEKGKVVVLVNGATASASEIFTAALQEWDRALIIGEVTYGKGLIQQSYLLGDSSAVRLTIGRYYTPTNRMLQKPFNYNVSNDWIFQNLAIAVTNKNGFTAELETPDSVTWKTKSGRKILKGAGGIIPDIYMSLPTIEKPLLKKLNDIGILYRFTVFHSDKNREKYLTQFKNGTAFRIDKNINRLIEKDFSKFLLDNLDDKEFALSITTKPLPKAVKQQIKAWIGPQLWESETYFSIFNEDDSMILRAVETIKDGTFERLGIR